MQNLNEKKTQPALELDLNEREKKRFAHLYRELAKMALECADAIEKENNSEILKTTLFFSIRLTQTTELHEILTAAALKAVSKTRDEFPDKIL